MGKRDSDTDIRKYMPDLATIIKHADPAYGERIFREAVDNPELDAALDERKRGLEALEQKSGATKTAVTGVSASEAPAELRVSAPSPWANGASGDAIDKSALPSATAPKADTAGAAPPVTSPVRVAITDRARPDGRRTLPRWVLPGIFAIALAPLAMWAVVSSLPPRHPPAVPGAASAQATASFSDGGPTPSGPSSAPPPSATPPASAGAPAAPPNEGPSVPVVPPRPRQPSQKPRGGDADPYGDAAAPPQMKTADPVPPNIAEPTGTATSASSSTPPTSASSKALRPEVF